jgi:hypothetical protein
MNCSLREDEASKTCGTPDEEHLDSKIGGLDSVDTGCGWVDEVGGRVTYTQGLSERICGKTRTRRTDTEVPEPVASDTERHTLGTDVEGLEDMT